MHKNYRRIIPNDKSYKTTHNGRHPLNKDCTHDERQKLKKYSDKKLRMAYRDWLSKEDWESLPHPLLIEVDDIWYYR